jgi:hypothetical protein
VSTVVAMDPGSLSALAAEINLLHDEAERQANLAVIYAARCGGQLLKAKAQVSHGQWLDWLAANCRVKDRQAAKYMRLARAMPELLDPNSQSTANLPGIEHAVALLTADDDVKVEVQARLDAGEMVSVREIDQLKREAQAAKEAREQLSAKLEQVQKTNQILHDNLAAASEREQRSYRELLETQGQIASLAEQQAQAAIAEAREESKAAVERARQDAQAAQQRVVELRLQLQQAETDQKGAIERGVNYNLAQRQVELNKLEQDIQYAENSLTSFRQKLREISSAEYENQRLNIDAEKVLREIVLFGTTLNLYESDEIFPVNWHLLEQIIVGAESLAALAANLRARRRLSE